MCSYFFLLGIIEPCMQDSIRALESVSLLPARCGPLLIRTEQPDVGRPTQLLIDPERLCCEGQVDREREREGGEGYERAETLRSPLRNAGDDRSRHAKQLPISHQFINNIRSRLGTVSNPKTFHPVIRRRTSTSNKVRRVEMLAKIQASAHVGIVRAWECDSGRQKKMSPS